MQYTHPTFKTAATQYALPTSQNHSSTCTKSQHLPLNTTAVPYQPNTHHILKHTYKTAQSDNHHSSKRSSVLPTLQATTHLPYHIPPRPTHKTHTIITYQTSPILVHLIFPYSPPTQTHIYAPRKEQQ